MVKDPVCGMEVNEESTVYYTHYRHETVFFCSEICKQSYDISDETDHRSWLRKSLDRIIGSNVREFGRVSSKNDSEGRAEYPLCQHVIKVPKMDFAFDPVCQTEVEKGNAPSTRQIEGKSYYFCSAVCVNRFDERPEIYTGGMKAYRKEKKSPVNFR
jgi:YHS domain-containing protein